MPIVRVSHAARRRWVTVSVSSIENADLSYGAVGLWVCLMAKPEDWQLRIPQLADAHGVSEYKTRQYLKELADANLARLTRPRSDDGTVQGQEWIVYEQPHGQDGGSPACDIAGAGDLPTSANTNPTYRENKEDLISDSKPNLSKNRTSPDHNAGATDVRSPAGGLPFEPDPASIPERDPPKRQDLAEVKVPLSANEREKYGAEIERVWHTAQRDQIEHLYSMTFGERGSGRSKLMPRGTEFRIINDLTRTYPWEWLVPAFVIASAKRADVGSVHRFIEPWLRLLEGQAGAGGQAPLPFDKDDSGPATHLPDPPTGSYTEGEKDAETDDYGLGPPCWNEHETNQGKRWTLTSEGKKRKRSVVNARLQKKQSSTDNQRSAAGK